MILLQLMLVVSLGSVIVAVSSVTAAFSYRDGMIEANKLFDAKLAHSARVLMGLVDDALVGKEMVGGGEPIVIDVWKASGTGTGNDPQPGHAYETRLAFQVWDGNGGLRLRSDAGPVQALAEPVPGFTNDMINGALCRVSPLPSARGYWYDRRGVQ